MIFEIDKYYQHSSGTMIHIMQKVNTTIYGECLLGEDDKGNLVPIGMTKSHAENWKLISKEKYLEKLSK